MGDDRKITDCDHFLLGNCRRGDSCFYRHPMKLHYSMVVCKYWQTYSCTNFYCPYLHPAVLPPYAPTYKEQAHKEPYQQPYSKDQKELSTESLSKEKSSKSAVVCAYYMSGRCSKSDCPYMHSLPDTVSSRHPQCE